MRAPAFLCASHGRTSHHTLAPHAMHVISCRASPHSRPLELIFLHTGVHAASWAVGKVKMSWRDAPGRRAEETSWGEKTRRETCWGDVLERGDEPGRRAREMCRGDVPDVSRETSRGDVPRGACVYVCEPERKRESVCVCVTSAYGVC